MSTEPTGLDGKVTRKIYIEAGINRENLCGYKGECLIDNVIGGDRGELCLSCRYRTALDVPTVLMNKYVERKEKIEKGY